MDFLCEFIFELILEGIFGLTIKNPRVKTWIKTTVYPLLAEGVCALLGIACVSMYRGGNTSGGIGCGILAALLAIGFLLCGIYGHKKNWKQCDEKGS